MHTLKSSRVDATIALEWQTQRLIERVAFCVCFPFSSVSFTFNGATMAKLAQCATPTTATATEETETETATATGNGNRNSWLAPGHVSECCLWSKHVSNESKNSLALCPFESVCVVWFSSCVCSPAPTFRLHFGYKRMIKPGLQLCPAVASSLLAPTDLPFTVKRES